MARKRGTDVHTNGTTAVAEAPPPVADAPPEPTAANRPVFKVGPIPTDRDNSVEVAVWSREVTSGDRSFTVYNATVHASYRDKDGQWQSAKGFRGSQIPVLVYCLQKAHDWILSQRDPSNCPF